MTGDMVGLCEERKKHNKGSSQIKNRNLLFTTSVQNRRNIIQSTSYHTSYKVYVNLRFVEKMYSFPDNLRKPSCEQGGKKESGTDL